MEKPKNVRNWKHGLAYTPTYRIWATMKGRCQNTNDARYESYGGRGITVCDRWQDYANFHEDMGDRPEGLSIDRKDNDLGYFKENCRWATDLEQNNNSRNVHWIEHDGIRDTTIGWSKRLNCPVSVLRTRIHKGWSTKDILSPPFGRNRTKRNSKRIELNGESLTIPEWATKTGVPRNVISYRLSAGWPIDMALNAPVGTIFNRH